MQQYKNDENRRALLRRVMDLLSAGASYSEAGGMLGITKGAIAGLLSRSKKKGINIKSYTGQVAPKVRVVSWPKDLWKDYQRLIDEGFTRKEIADIWKMPKNTLDNKAQGWAKVGLIASHTGQPPKTPHEPVTPQEIEKPLIDNVRAIPFQDIGPNECRFPLWGPHDKWPNNRNCCGNPIAFQGAAYCDGHYKAAYDKRRKYNPVSNHAH